MQQESIAIIDDTEIIRNYLEQQLTACNYHVSQYESGIPALVHIPNACPDLILLDVNMPRMDGFEVCKELKKNPKTADIPVLFLSGEKESDLMLKGFEAGAVDYVTKPVSFQVLKARIETHLKLYQLQREQREQNRALESLVSQKIEALYTSQVGTISALAQLAEHRDEDTGLHLERVQAYCTCLAKDLALQPGYSEITAWFIKLITFASSLHDIGKVAIPDAILLKPGKLDADEFTIMKSHSQQGADTLARSLETDSDNEFLQMGHAIALSHHEKWDGSGYPHGTAGTETPLSARIMAIADVYDALRSERCYKKGFSHQKAYGIIDEGAGTHFDPRIVESFIRNQEKFDAIWEGFQE